MVRASRYLRILIYKKAILEHAAPFLFPDILGKQFFLPLSLWVADGVYDRVEHGGGLGGHGRDLRVRGPEKRDVFETAKKSGGFFS